MPKQTVLIIEDEKPIVNVLRNKLILSGLDVLVGANGNEGLQLLRSGSADIAVVDILMPELDGLEMLRLYSKDKDRKSIPIILLTNVTVTDTILTEMEKLGVSQVIVKAEMTLTNVVDRIKSILKRA